MQFNHDVGTIIAFYINLGRYLLNCILYVHRICISLAVLHPNFTNMTKITYLQALIDSSMTAELKKCNKTPKKFAWTLDFAP